MNKVVVRNVIISLSLILIAFINISTESTLAAVSVPQLASAPNYSQYLSVDVVKTPNNDTYFIVTNSSEKVLAVTFDFSFYDKDKSYINGGTFLVPNYFVLANSTIGYKWGNLNWDTYKISNIRAEELTNPFTKGSPVPFKIAIYYDMVFVEGPILGNSKTLDSKWNIESSDNKYYIVGEIKNNGNVTPYSLKINVIFWNKGKVVGVFEGYNIMNPMVPPPGEKIKFKTLGAFPPNVPSSPRMPDSYDTYKATIICASKWIEGLERGPEPSKTTPEKPSGQSPTTQPKSEKTGCFIATAAYGTPEAEEINILRKFRDDFLLKNYWGRQFVSIYYTVSPPIANFISEHELLRTAVREGFVNPIVFIINSTRILWHTSK